MESEIIDITTGVLIGGTIIYLLILLIIAQIRYSTFLNHIKRVKPEYKEDLEGLLVTEKGGDWFGGIYIFRTPLPISLKTKNEEIRKLVESHNKIIKYFCISSIVIIPTLIIILHLIN